MKILAGNILSNAMYNYKRQLFFLKTSLFSTTARMNCVFKVVFLAILCQYAMADLIEVAQCT